MKDNFSDVASEYAQYRPSYPDELFEYIFQRTKQFEKAWDCGTGNGQVAIRLAKKFKQILATDISKNQLHHAIKANNIDYQLIAAEEVNYPSAAFDLITVAQAIHWFDFDRFYEKVRISLKPDGLIAILGYGLMQTNSKCDASIWHLYKNILGDYWDPERHYIENHYKDIPFPFKEIDAPKFSHHLFWTVDDMINYLNTWSAVQHYIDKNQKNPIDEIETDLRKEWTGKIEVTLPILFRLGKKN